MEQLAKRPMQMISVIVPIYNAESTLGHCVESILNQTYTNLEIILVNDGSQDESLSICRRFASVDSRILVIDTPNQGVSKARNEGLRVATGTCIGFVDADDWIDKDMFEFLYQGMQSEPSNCMAVVGVHARRWETYLSNLCKGEIHHTISLQIALMEVINPYGLRGYLWNKLFLNKHQYLDETIQVCEDLEFVVRYLLSFSTGTVSVLNINCYHYNVTEIHDFSKLRYTFEKTYSKIATYQIIIAQLNAEYTVAIDLNKTEICMTCYSLLLFWYGLSERERDDFAYAGMIPEIKKQFVDHYTYGISSVGKSMKIKLFLLKNLPLMLVFLLRSKQRVKKQFAKDR